MAVARYSVLVARGATGALVATVPELPGIVAQGGTLDEVLDLTRGAIELHIEDMLAEGKENPVEVAAPQLDTVEVALPPIRQPSA